MWTVLFEADFDEEFKILSQEVQDDLLASAKLLEKFGPQLARPHADTLNGSSYPNMKELRFQSDGGVWRVAFAFDPKRKAFLLAAGDKSGVSESNFYKRLIKKADKRYKNHVETLDRLEKLAKKVK